MVESDIWASLVGWATEEWEMVVAMEETYVIVADTLKAGQVIDHQIELVILVVTLVAMEEWSKLEQKSSIPLTCLLVVSLLQLYQNNEWSTDANVSFDFKVLHRLNIQLEEGTSL